MDFLKSYSTHAPTHFSDLPRIVKNEAIPFTREVPVATFAQNAEQLLIGTALAAIEEVRLGPD